MKAILEFSLPEEQSEFTVASNSGALACVLWDVLCECRTNIKHGNGAYEPIQELILESLGDRGLTMDVLTQ